MAKDYPDVQTNSLLVDAAAMDFVRKPEAFDVVVASNLFGDILTDLSAIVTGSMGLAASANINPERTYPSMFEPVHGSAPDIAGKGIANPLAAILSAGMLLDFLGLAKGAAAVKAAVAGYLKGSRPKPPDLGGTREDDRGDGRGAGGDGLAIGTALVIYTPCPYSNNIGRPAARVASRPRPNRLQPSHREGFDMDGNWFYAQDNCSFGPYTWAEFRAVAASGTLRRTSTVWREGMTEGVVASTVTHLFPQANKVTA